MCLITVIDNTTAVAFCAARTTSFATGSEKRVLFDYELVDTGNVFDLNSSVFTAPYGGYYWLHYSIGVEQYNQADAYLTGSERISNVIRSYSGYSGQDILSRDEIFDMRTECGQVKLWSDFDVFSDAYLQTSFSGFSIQGLSDDSPTVFSIALSSSYTCQLAAKVPFDRVIIDSRNGWSNADRDYIVPETGTYVISLLAGSDPNDELGVGLYVYGSILSSVQLGSTDHQFESLGTTITAELFQYDRLYAGCYYYSPSYLISDIKAQTLMTGFLYKPRNFRGLSWSVASVASVTGPAYPVAFPVQILDRGFGWDKISNTYVVPEDGVYYIHLTAGVNTAQRTNLELQVNTVTIANVYMSSTDHNGFKTRSRAIIIRLNTGDVLRCNLPTGFFLYSNNNRITMFTGFRVAP